MRNVSSQVILVSDLNIWFVWASCLVLSAPFCCSKSVTTTFFSFLIELSYIDSKLANLIDFISWSCLRRPWFWFWISIYRDTSLIWYISIWCWCQQIFIWILAKFWSLSIFYFILICNLLYTTGVLLPNFSTINGQKIISMSIQILFRHLSNFIEIYHLFCANINFRLSNNFLYLFRNIQKLTADFNFLFLVGFLLFIYFWMFLSESNMLINIGLILHLFILRLLNNIF